MTQEISIKYTKQLIDAVNRLARAKENENRIAAAKWLYTYRFASDSTDESYIKLIADVSGIDIVEEKGEAENGKD